MATALPTSLMPTLPSSIDRTKEMFYLANIEYPRYPSLTPEMAAEMLAKAMNLLSQINFSYLFINKPADGQVYLIYLQSNIEELPSDGFQYLEGEVSYKTTLPDGRELLCTERRHGFAEGDQVTSKVRRRYRLSMGNESIQLLHYVKLEEHLRQILNPTMMMRTPVRKHPLTPIQSNVSPYIRGPQQPPIQAHHIHTQPAMRPSNPTMIPPAASASPYVQFQSRVTPMGAGHRGGNPSVLQSTKRRGKSTKIAAAAEDMEEPSGDELDNIKLREVALARYRRNHEYIEEIFSPFSTSSIKPHPSPYASKDAEELKAKLAEYKTEIESITKRHEENLKNFKEPSTAIFKSMRDIKNHTKIEELDRLQESIEKELNIIYKPCTTVKQVVLNHVANEEMGNLAESSGNATESLQQLNHQELAAYDIHQGLVVGTDASSAELHGMLDTSVVYDEFEVLASHIAGDVPIED